MVSDSFDVQLPCALALPIEILERFLDHYGGMLILYHHDLNATGDRCGYYKPLRSWALTCKALLPRCRYNLYRSVLLWGKQQHDKFLRTLENNPYLANYIRALHLFGSAISRPPSILIYLAGKLPHVRALQLSICPGIFAHQSLHRALSSFSTVTMLILAVRIGVPDVQRLLHTLAHLRYLELADSPMDFPNSNPRCRACSPPRCHLTSFIASLRLDAQSAIPSMGVRRTIRPPNSGWFTLYRALLRTPEFMSTVRRLYIQVMSWEGRTETNANITSSLLSTAGASLEEAFIYFHERENTGLTREFCHSNRSSGAHSPVDLITLQDNTELRRLGLFLDNTFDEEVGGLVPLLSTVSSTILQEIVLFGWDGFRRVQSSTWALLDEALCDSRFDTLTSIQVIEDDEDRNLIPPAKRLPRCASRGLISSSYVSSALDSL